MGWISKPWDLKNPRASAMRKGISLFHAKLVKTTRRFFFSCAANFPGRANDKPQNSSRTRNRAAPLLISIGLNLLLEPAFGFEFLLGDFENTVINNPVYGKLAVDDAGTNIFVEHLLDAGDGNR